MRERFVMSRSESNAPEPSPNSLELLFITAADTARGVGVEGEIVSVITPERADLFLDLLRDRHGANATRTEERRELAQRQPSPEEMTAGFIVWAAIAHALPDQDLAIQVAIDGTAAAFRFSEYAERFGGDREYPAGSRNHWAACVQSS